MYDDGQVIPSSLQTIKPNLEYSLVVSLSTDIQYGRAILVMDKGFCTDNAGNHFILPQNSSLVVRFGEHMNQTPFSFSNYISFNFDHNFLLTMQIEGVI